MMERNSERHCFELVKAADRERYLSALFAPDAKRGPLLGLYAFNLELARIRETVSEASIGEIRLQWWADAIDAIYAREIPSHPVAQELSRAVELGDLPKHALANMIEARRFDLYDDPMPSLNDLEGYLGETSSALIQMAARVLAGDDALGAAETSGLAGVAYGIAGLMRSLPVHRARGQCYIPETLLNTRDLTPAHVLAGRDSPAMQLALSDLRHHAQRRLAEARSKAWLVPKPAFPAFLPVALLDSHLKALRRKGVSVLVSGAEVSPLRLQWRMFWQAKWETF